MGDREQIKEILKERATPCLRTTLLYGIGVGITAGATHFVWKRNMLRAANFAVVAFCSVGMVSWITCSTNHRLEQLNVRSSAARLRDAERKKMVELLERQKRGEIVLGLTEEERMSLEALNKEGE